MFAYIIKTLIEKENVDTFYVGSRNEFDDLCRQVLLEQKIKYPHIKRIYVRAEYPDISEEYKNCNGDLRYYQPKSGTAIAYKYAIQKKKKIINLAENI